MGIDGITGLLSGALDKIFPDAAERDKAKIRMLELQQAGQFKELDAAMSAIMAEANSEHKFVALARPMFLYVIYVFILSALPMGALFAYDPSMAANVATGVNQWLSAIPEAYITLFGMGYLGYSGARSLDKRTKAKK